jgi:hypothetical protein
MATEVLDLHLCNGGGGILLGPVKIGIPEAVRGDERSGVEQP